MAALESLGGETWFRLGDGDLATHVERTRRLGPARALSAITDDFRRRLGISARAPADERRPGAHAASDRRRLARFPGLFRAPALRAGGARDRLRRRRRRQPRIRRFSPRSAIANLRAVVICPSNPFISIDPILALPGVREALRACRAPVVAVSPIIGGRAVKGPTAKMMAELGLPVDAAAVARHYRDILDCYVVDAADAAQAADLGVPVTLTRSVDAHARRSRGAGAGGADRGRPVSRATGFAEHRYR